MLVIRPLSAQIPRANDGERWNVGYPDRAMKIHALDFLGDLVSRVGPAVAVVAAGVCAVLGILIIVFPDLLAWITGIALLVAGLVVIAYVATGLRWGGAVASDEEQGPAPPPGA